MTKKWQVTHLIRQSFEVERLKTVFSCKTCFSHHKVLYDWLWRYFEKCWGPNNIGFHWPPYMEEKAKQNVLFF